jgi:hypothetical protein
VSGRLLYGVKLGATLVVLVVLTLAAIGWMVRSRDDDPVVAPAPPVARSSSPGPPAPTWTSSPTGRQVVVPNLVGRNAASAAKELRSLGFGRVLCLTPDDDETEPTARWTVTGQTVEAGTRMAAVEGPFYLNCA